MPHRLSGRTPSHRASAAGWPASALAALSVLNSWQGVLATMGAVAVITIVVALFLPFGKGPQLIRPLASVPAVDSPEFLRLMSTVLNAPIEAGSEPQILNNG